MAKIQQFPNFQDVFLIMNVIVIIFSK